LRPRRAGGRELLEPFVLWAALLLRPPSFWTPSFWALPFWALPF
jgi:hypothetical protein